MAYNQDYLGNTGGITYVEITIYIDVLWLRTFLVELLVCVFVNQWMKQAQPTARILWMSAVAVTLEVLMFVVAGYGVWFAIGSLALRMLLLNGVFRPKSVGLFLRIFLWSLVATVGVGGVLSVCQEHLPQRYWFSAGSIVCAIGIMVSLLLEERRHTHDRNLYRVKLVYAKNEVEVTALYDTGNRLQDPYVHAPVHILAHAEAQRLGLPPEELRLIPFSTVGAPQGLMEAWTIDAMEWTGGRLEHVVIGVAENILFEKKDYRLILSAGWRSE